MVQRRTSANRRHRRRILAPAMMGVAALALTACSGGADLKGSEGTMSGDVVFWSSFTQGPRAEYMEEMAKKFEKDHPGVNIKIETFSWNEFNTKWTTGLSTGAVPDASTALPNQVVQMINVDALAPVDDVIDDIGRDRFYESALSEGAAGGKNYSVPIYTHAQVMWYRKDLLAQAGIEVPTTWDELRSAAEKLSTDGVYGLSVPFGSNDVLATRYLNFYMQSAGENLIDDSGRANLTSKAAIDGISYWTDLYKDVSPKGSSNYNVLDQATLFYQGKTAIDFNSGFHISGVEGASPDLVDDIAAAPLPRMHESDPVYGGETSNTPIVVWKASSKRAAAKEFVKTLYNDDDYIRFLHSVPGGMLPALKDIESNEAYLDDEVLEEFSSSVDVIADAVPLGSAMGMENGPQVQAGLLTNQAVIEDMFQDIALNGVPVKEAAQQAEDKLNRLFETAGVTFE
ncbi:ABC transporter substrate-binding protein [Paramicrobacterium chengjingii]|nr:sugar ABC transporter substrate-binding protein [Microbacterium chengjingii]